MINGCIKLGTAGTAAVDGIHVHINHAITNEAKTAIHGAAGRQEAESVSRNHSQSAQPAMTSNKAISGQGLLASKAPSNTARRTTAVNTRCINMETSLF